MTSQSKRTFQVGDAVEVCCNEEGFLGSYWEATIIATIRSICLVEYKHFVEEHDESTPLRETVKRKDLRPLPPNIVPSRYSSLQGHRVDAFLKDVWWVGTISRKVDADHYIVFFENTGEEIACPFSKLRFHMDWFNGEWVPSKKRRAPVTLELSRPAPVPLKKKEEVRRRTILF
ncbi:hypothetical protein ACLB2K_019578 [Fragaria x ananassa]